MAPRPTANARFRQRKLNQRSALQVFKGEKELESLEDDQQSGQRVETGVEKNEETEHHLQAAISAFQAAATTGGNVAHVYIPTPETAQSTISYAQLYQRKFHQPQTYIRSSSTVEDSCGCPYNMTDVDDQFLKGFNERLVKQKGATAKCSEDQFEEVMNFFEETARTQQPFSSVGEPPPVLSWEEMQNSFDENLEEPARVFAKDIYQHWKALRSKNGNASIHPALKVKVMDSTNDTDDNDPYVCFRRREVRQVRKTRGRDAQSVEKLKKLRRELEDARQLLRLVKERETVKKEQLAVDKQLFEDRAALRQCKRALGEPYIQGDEDLLITQKAPKKKPLQVNTQTNTINQPRPVPRPDGRTAEQELVLLDDVNKQRDVDVQREIYTKTIQHQKWNVGWVDSTNEPLTPPPTGDYNESFRSALTEYLPTPPASHSYGSDEQVGSPENPLKEFLTVGTEYPFPQYRYQARDESPIKDQPSFRRRLGRGGRMIIDRRGLRVQDKAEIDPVLLDRWKYDRDDDDMQDVVMIDPYEIQNMRYRAAISGSSMAHTQAQAVRRSQQAEAASSAGEKQTGGGHAGPATSNPTNNPPSFKETSATA